MLIFEKFILINIIFVKQNMFIVLQKIFRIYVGDLVGDLVDEVFGFFQNVNYYEVDKEFDCVQFVFIVI